MADIASIGGTELNKDGWAKVKDFTDPTSGDKQTVYKGRADSLGDFVDELKKEVGYDEIIIDKGASDATATVTIIKTYGADSEKPAKPSENEVALPDVVLQGSMLQVPLCQAPKFGLSEDGTVQNGLTIQRVKTIEYLLREKGTITKNDAGPELAQQYASWLMLGMKTYEKPVYTLSITYHLRVDKAKNVEKFVQSAGKVLNFDDITGELPARLNVYHPTGFEKWLAQAPTVKYGANSIDVSQTFIGAKDWPNYYDNGTWEAPEIAY